MGWKWSTVAELAADEPYSITDGPFGLKLKMEHYTDLGPRVIRLQNIGDGEFRDEKSHVSKEHFATLKRHKDLCRGFGNCWHGGILTTSLDHPGLRWRCNCQSGLYTLQT